MKAQPKADLKVGQEADENGHEDMVVTGMLDKGIMFLEPYQKFDGTIVPNWYCDNSYFGYNWHISWLDVIEE